MSVLKPSILYDKAACFLSLKLIFGLHLVQTHTLWLDFLTAHMGDLEGVAAAGLGLLSLPGW